MGWFSRWRRARAAQSSPVDDRAWAAVVRRFSFLRTLPAADQARLRDCVAAFLHEKSIHGAGGLELDDAMRLLIAAQACLLVLNLDLDWYDDWVEVIVYPDEFIVEHEYTDEDGVVHRVREPRSGEAWDRGPVVLSWVDAEAADGGDGYNVVIHEVTHFLEHSHPGGDPAAHAALAAAHEALCDAVDRGEDTLLDPYGAEDLTEFLAVAAEFFFERPHELRERHPTLYVLLRDSFRLDPAAWADAAA